MLVVDKRPRATACAARLPRQLPTAHHPSLPCPGISPRPRVSPLPQASCDVRCAMYDVRPPPPDPRCPMCAARPPMLDARCSMCAARYSMADARCATPVTDRPPPAVRCAMYDARYPTHDTQPPIPEQSRASPGLRVNTLIEYLSRWHPCDSGERPSLRAISPFHITTYRNSMMFALPRKKPLPSP